MERATLPELVAEKSLFSDYFVRVFPHDFAASFVGQFGWMSVPLPMFVHLLYGVLAIGAALGLAIRLVKCCFRDEKTLFAL